MQKHIRLSILIICSVLFVWFLLPIFLAYYKIGSIFGHLVILFIAFMAVFYGKFKKKGLKIFMNVALVILILGLLWTMILSVKILSGSKEEQAPSDATVIVLGCQVTKNGPSLSLKKRLDLAYDYLSEHENANCIVTGGQGYNEPISEAMGSKIYLEDKGIDPSRIYLEDKSTSTWENFLFAIDVLEENNFSKNVIVVTQDFHIYRACEQAKELGLNTYALSVKDHPLLYPNDFGRELLALTKYYFLRLWR